MTTWREDTVIRAAGSEEYTHNVPLSASLLLLEPLMLSVFSLRTYFSQIQLQLGFPSTPEDCHNHCYNEWTIILDNLTQLWLGYNHVSQENITKLYPRLTRIYESGFFYLNKIHFYLLWRNFFLLLHIKFRKSLCDYLYDHIVST